MHFTHWPELTRGQRIFDRLVWLTPMVFTIAGSGGVLLFIKYGRAYLPPSMIFIPFGIFFFGVILTLLAFCILAYWLREHRRWLYGVFELVFALIVLIVATLQIPGSGHGSGVWSVPMVSTLAQYAAGVYVMVRGFDNIGQGVKNDPVWGRRWRWFSLHRVDPATGDSAG